MAAKAAERQHQAATSLTQGEHALHAQRRIHHSCWLLAAADLISTLEPHDLQLALRLAARRVHASRSLPHRERLAVVRFLYAKAIQFV